MIFEYTSGRFTDLSIEVDLEQRVFLDTTDIIRHRPWARKCPFEDLPDGSDEKFTPVDNRLGKDLKEFYTATLKILKLKNTLRQLDNLYDQMMQDPPPPAATTDESADEEIVTVHRNAPKNE